MICPSCSNNHPKKEGMICSCGYRFLLGPDAYDGISDNMVKSAIANLSTTGAHHFTYDQLYVQLYRAVRKKKHGLFGQRLFQGILFGIFFGLFTIFLFPINFLVGVCVLFWNIYRPFRFRADLIAEAIRIYHEAHPIENMVDGTAFANQTSREFSEEIFDYAPERILIVQRNDVVDMLLLNRYHIEHKTLVVGLEKYPKPAFDACQRFLLKHPDIPITILHDCSKSGVKMKETLTRDLAWNLKEKRIQNLGLSPEHLKRAKQPIWMPEDIEAHDPKTKVLAGGDPEKLLDKGYRMSMGVARPLTFMSVVALAATTGFALMSSELLAEQASRSGNGSDAGGFG